MGGAVYSYVCGEDQAMDWETKECVSIKDVNCPQFPPSSPKCVNQSNGFFPDYEDNCHSYYGQVMIFYINNSAFKRTKKTINKT